MTNAEKFYEVFGTKGWVDWDAEYKGEPTIPLSVIEKIKAEIIQYFMQNKDSEDLFLAGCGDGAYHALAIIDEAVKGVDK